MKQVFTLKRWIFYCGQRRVFSSPPAIAGFVSVFPQGLDDAVPGGSDLGTGWNVGTAGGGTFCLAEAKHSCSWALCPAAR